MNRKDLLLTPEEIQNITVGITGRRVEGVPIPSSILITEIAQAQLDKAIPLIREEALIEGITMYAWWKDGIQYIGTTGRTLKKAIAEIKSKK